MKTFVYCQFGLYFSLFFLLTLKAHAFDESWRTECFEDTLLEKKTCYAYVFGDDAVLDKIRVYINNKGQWGIFFGNNENIDKFSKTIVKVGENKFIKLKSNFISGVTGQKILNQFSKNEDAFIQVRIYGFPETRNYSAPMTDFLKSYRKIKNTFKFDPLTVDYSAKKIEAKKLGISNDENLDAMIKTLSDLVEILKEQERHRSK